MFRARNTTALNRNILNMNDFESVLWFSISQFISISLYNISYWLSKLVRIFKKIYIYYFSILFFILDFCILNLILILLYFLDVCRMARWDATENDVHEPFAIRSHIKWNAANTWRMATIVARSSADERGVIIVTIIIQPGIPWHHVNSAE